MSVALSDPTIVLSAAPPAGDPGNGSSPDRADTVVVEAIEAEAVEAELEVSPPAEHEAELPPAPLPLPPGLPLRRRLVRGRYRSAGTGWQLELRVDVDGTRPMRRVSGDFFSSAGATTTYFGSFVMHAPTIHSTPTQVRIEGMGTFTWAAAAPLVRITIPRATILHPAHPATVQFLTPPSTPGASYLCPYASPFFRSVQFEQDSVAGTVPFVSYDTGSLPQPPGSAARALTVPKAYAEAGIELQVAGTASVLPASTAGSSWTDAELHNAMVNHFSLWADTPQWRVWMLVATTHADGARGIMFDYSDAHQRQGAAVFYDAIGGTDPATQRAALRTYVHEVGHAFNLLHSWQKNLATPPQPLGPNGGLGDLSWMNYAWRYQPPPPAAGGEGPYWAAFPFQFTDNELVHLRHGFYKDVIMGANAFAVGAAALDPEQFDAPVVDNSGLALELRARPAFAYGEPVVVELKLSTTDTRGKETHGYLHPKDDFVTIAIRRPSGQTIAYRPMLRRCMDEDRRIRLDQDRPALYDSAYIGYGQDGFAFEQPGRYLVRASYIADDGSRVMSPVLRFWVRPPVSAQDEEVGELLMDEDAGKLLYLLGSDAPSLHAGNAALDTILERHGDHPLAIYARLAKGVNAERDFRDLSAEHELTVREHDAKASVKLLSAVEKASRKDQGVDNITLNQVMRRLASAEAKAGDTEAAAKSLDRMVDVFRAKNLSARVLETVREQAATARQRLLGDRD